MKRLIVKCVWVLGFMERARGAGMLISMVSLSWAQAYGFGVLERLSREVILGSIRETPSRGRF